MIHRLFSYLLLGLGLYYSVAAIRLYLLLRKAPHWPTVKGRIIKSEMSSGMRRIRGLQFRYISEPRIEFEYEINAETHRNDRYALVQVSTANEALAQSVIDRYPIGATVDVHVNPKHPEDGTLEFAKPGAAVFPLIVGLGLAVAGIVLMIGSQ